MMSAKPMTPPASGATAVAEAMISDAAAPVLGATATEREIALMRRLVATVAGNLDLNRWRHIAEGRAEAAARIMQAVSAIHVDLGRMPAGVRDTGREILLVVQAVREAQQQAFAERDAVHAAQGVRKR